MAGTVTNALCEEQPSEKGYWFATPEQAQKIWDAFDWWLNPNNNDIGVKEDE